MPKRTRNQRLPLLAVLAAAAVLAASCGSSSGSSGSAGSSPSGEMPVAEAKPASFAAGCDEATAWIDPTNRSVDRPVARCAPNTPAAVPLPELTPFDVCASTFSLAFVAPIVLAEAKGEFEAENLDVNLTKSSASDCLPLVARGEVDAIWATTDAPFFNLGLQEANLRLVMGNFYSAPESKAGLWVNTSCDRWNGQVPTAGDLTGAVIGSVNGPSSAGVTYPLGDAIRAAGGSIADIQLRQLPSGDDFTNALSDCAVDAAWVSDPLWVPLQDDPDMAFLFGSPAGEPVGGLMFGPSVLVDDQAKGVAFVRALIRTINTYLPVDYDQDADLINELSTLLSVPVDRLQATPPLQFDWEIRDGLTTRIQENLIEFGSQQGDQLPEEQTTDRSFYGRALSAP